MLTQRTETERLVDLLNSVHLPDGDDHLADDRATSWLSTWLGRDAPTPEPAALEALSLLREGLRQLVAANNGAETDPASIARAAAVLRGSPVVVDLGDVDRAPGLTAIADGDPARQAVTAACAAYLIVRTGADWARIKACAAPDCRWAFVDTSRNRSRRWCDMAGCGNRTKNRDWRERHRTPR